jgi:hypothetical protein
MLQPNNMLNSLIPTAINLLIVIVGWKVLFKNAQKISSRSETFNIISALAKTQEEILQLSQDFWLGDNLNSQNFHCLVLGKIKVVKSNLILLEDRYLIIPKKSTLITAIRSSCLLDCERIGEIGPTARRIQFGKILNSLHSLENEINKSFHSKYPVSK